MAETISLLMRFEAERPRLQGVASRMLGSVSEAEDAVQEAWLRLSRDGGEEVENLAGWLTTVVSRLCLDILRRRRASPEEPETPAMLGAPDSAETPEQNAILSDAVGYALQVVLDTLAPHERVAYVLHDIFGLSFDDIAPIVDRSATAARQLASRARHRIRGVTAMPEADFLRKRELIAAFLAASRGGDLQGLLAVLAPEVELRTDPVAHAEESKSGRDAVATFFVGRAQAGYSGLIDGDPGIVVRLAGRLLAVLQVKIGPAGITDLDVVADPAVLAKMDIVELAP